MRDWADPLPDDQPEDFDDRVKKLDKRLDETERSADDKDETPGS